MLVSSTVTTDARVLREATTLAAAGHQVHVVGKDVPPDAKPPGGVEISTAGAGHGLRRAGDPRTGTSRSRPRRLARWLLLPEHRRLSFGHWAEQAARAAAGLPCDVVHAHDFTALELGSRLALQRNIPLVYDAHELWFERHRAGRPTPVQNIRQRRTERRLGGGAAAVITVGEALAQKLRDSYGWTHVTVVRNSFPVDPSALVELKTPSAAVYAGRLAPARDLETVAAASRRTSFPLRLLGPSDPSWLERFAPGQCTVGSAVELSAVDAELRTAGLALVTLSDRWGNHRIALPNKLFHAVRVGIPVVASDVGELARTVRAHGIGVLYRPGDAASLVAAIDEAQTRYPALVAAVRRASAKLSWATDREALLQVYAGLGR